MQSTRRTLALMYMIEERQHACFGVRVYCMVAHMCCGTRFCLHLARCCSGLGSRGRNRTRTRSRSRRSLVLLPYRGVRGFDLLDLRIRRIQSRPPLELGLTSSKDRTVQNIFPGRVAAVQDPFRVLDAQGREPRIEIGDSAVCSDAFFARLVQCGPYHGEVAHRVQQKFYERVMGMLVVACLIVRLVADVFYEREAQ